MQDRHTELWSGREHTHPCPPFPLVRPDIMATSRWLAPQIPPPPLDPDTETPCTGRMLSDLPFPTPNPLSRPLHAPRSWAPKKGAGDVGPQRGRGRGKVMLPRLVQEYGVPVSESTSTGGMEARQQEELPWATRAGAPPHPHPVASRLGWVAEEAGGGGCLGEDESFMSDLRPPLLVPCCLMFQFGRKQNIQSGGLSA